MASAIHVSWRVIRVTGFVSMALLLVGVLSCADEGSTELDAQAPAAAPADETPTEPPVTLKVGDPLPSLEPVPAGATTEPLEFGSWMALALVPRACAECEADYQVWSLETRPWATLEFVSISQRSVERLTELQGLDDIRFRMYSTERPLYSFLNDFDDALYVLVDPDGVVRFRSRAVGTDTERRESVRRAHRFLTMPEDERARRLMPAFPGAHEIEIAQVADEPALDSTADLGLSSWYGVARDEAGASIGYVFPIERDTNCDVCDALYLAVGVTERGTLREVVELETVISDGTPVDMTPLFEAVRGVGTKARLAQISAVLSSSQADIAARKIFALALGFFDRLAKT